MPYTAFPGIPFGGYKQSGFGRELGIDALELYLETKSVVVGTGTRPANPLGSSGQRASSSAWRSCTRSAMGRARTGRIRVPRRDAAHELAAEWIREAGLGVEVDAHGNLLGRSGQRDDLWVGSHLDSVPQGGKFDGPLGVVAAIEAVEQAGTVGRRLSGEEVGCIGSRALCRYEEVPSVFLELHIEQGPMLERAGVPLRSSRASSATRVRSCSSRVVPATPEPRPWPIETTRS